MIGDETPDPPLLATLRAVAGRLVPADEAGGGAAEAEAATYVLRVLAEGSEELRTLYATSVRAIDLYCGEQLGAPFAELDPELQDGILRLESGAAPWFGHGAAGFFELMRDHVIEGMFCDPRWGGNVDGIGWALLGYPGPKFVWTADDQRIEEIGERNGRAS